MKGLFYDGMNTSRVWLVDLAACAATGVLLGVVGPFGSFFNDVPPVRIVYWTIVFLLSGECSVWRCAGPCPGRVARRCRLGSGFRSLS